MYRRGVLMHFAAHSRWRNLKASDVVKTVQKETCIKKEAEKVVKMYKLNCKENSF